MNRGIFKANCDLSAQTRQNKQKLGKKHVQS